MILLYHENATHGMVATPEHVKGVPTPSRTYHHEGHFLAIDGDDPHVVEHDADLILKIAGFRIATPAEQNEYHAARRKKQQVVEDAACEKADEQKHAESSSEKPRGQRRKD